MTIETQMRIANNLAALRKTANLSQAALSEKIIVCRSTYAQYEQGDRLPDLDTLYSLANFYHIKLDTLVKCDMQSVLEDYFLHHEYTREETQLIEMYSKLSDFAKGRLIERAEELARIDINRREQTLHIIY